MKIESNDKNIQQLFTMGYLKIPRFQRPYSWERAEVEDFWNDTVVGSEGDYFIGSIVVFNYGGEIFGIVDGQQRLTTITMRWPPKTGPLVKMDFRRSAGEEKADHESKTQTA